MANDQSNGSNSSSNIYVPSSSSVSSSLSSASLSRSQLDDVAYDFGMIMMDLKTVCTTLSMLARQIDQVVQRVDNKFGYIIENINNFNLETNGTLAEESFNPKNVKFNKTTNKNSTQNYPKNGINPNNIVLNHASEPVYQSLPTSVNNIEPNRVFKDNRSPLNANQNGRSKVNNEIILTNLAQKTNQTNGHDPNAVVAMNGTRVIRTSSERKSTFGPNSTNGQNGSNPSGNNSYEINASISIEATGAANKQVKVPNGQSQGVPNGPNNVVPINHARLDRYDIWTSSSFLPQGAQQPGNSNANNVPNGGNYADLNNSMGEYSHVNPANRQHNFTKIKCTRSKSQPAFKESSQPNQPTIPTSESQKISVLASSSPLMGNSNTNYSPNNPPSNRNNNNVGTSGASITLLNESANMGESSFYEDQLDNELESISNSSSIINKNSGASIISNGGQTANVSQKLLSSSKIHPNATATVKAQEDLKEIINTINTMALNTALAGNNNGNNNGTTTANESLKPATTNIKGSKAKSGNGNHHVSFNINNAIYTSRQETPIPISILKPSANTNQGIMNGNHHGNMNGNNTLNQQQLQQQQQQQQKLMGEIAKHHLQQQVNQSMQKSTPNKSFTTIINNAGNSPHGQQEMDANYYGNGGNNIECKGQMVNSLATSSNLANSLSSMSSSSSSSASSPLQSSIKKSPGINNSLNQFNSDREGRNGVSNGSKSVRLDSKTTVL